jgi:8-oxo-dGTP pyrophosphatase MutT (NUDIX family)
METTPLASRSFDTVRAMRFSRIRERLVYQTPWTLVYDDEVLHPDGTPGTYTRVVPNGAPGGAHVIPRLPDGRVLLLKANRYPVGADVWEFPRGAPHTGETFEVAARRELAEESGLRANRLTFIGHCYPDTGILGSKHSVFLADITADQANKVKLDAGEAIIGHRWLRPEEIGGLIQAGDIVDGTVLADLMLLQLVQRRRAK